MIQVIKHTVLGQRSLSKR